MSNTQHPHPLFGIQDQTVVITGGSGVLGKAMATALAQAGARLAIVSLHQGSAETAAATIRDAGGQALGLACDTTDRAALEQAQQAINRQFGPIDILVNAAGGNRAQATTSAERSFFELDSDIIHEVFTLNFTGTLLSCQVFGRGMAERGQGCIVNVASMSGIRALTRVPVYSAAKAAIVNFTQWLAVHMAQEYNPHIRVNAIAPGFFLTEQNQHLMLTDDGVLTPRAQTIIEHTPAARLGTPADLVGTLLWLVSPASAFVTGIVVPVDGGFSAFGGV